MNNFYFTFGSDEHFPYPNSYIVIKAPTEVLAVEKFKKEYKSFQKGDAIPCSFWYSEESWERLGMLKYYLNGPSEILYIGNEDDFDDIEIFIPEKGQIISFDLGSGDNLMKEDEEEGFVDYINYEIYDYNDNFVDGGMMLTETSIQETYSSLVEMIPQLLDFIYDNEKVTCSFERG